MADQLSLRGGTTAEHATFTGANKEVTVDTTKKTLVVNDGATVGGHPLMRENASNSALALGSAGTPSLKFTGDTNTGIYSPGADQLAVATNGTGRLFIDANGNLGVGLSSIPNYNANLRTVSFNNTNGVVHDYAVNGVRTGSLVCQSTGFDLSTQTNIPLIFSTNSAERMRITSAGLVGVGTSSPDVSLHVKSAGSSIVSEFEATAAGFSSIDLSNTAGYARLSSVAGNLALSPAGTERARIDTSGRLGIGTSTAQSDNSLLNIACPGPTSGDGVIGGAITTATNSFRTFEWGIRVDGVGNKSAINFRLDPGSGGSDSSITFTTSRHGVERAERMRITSDAYVRLAAGTGGIQFNGDTAAANALDDYEEGTWTPSIYGTTTAGTTTYFQQAGSYTKVGRVVTVQVFLTITNQTGTGSLRLGNLPFTAAASANTFPCAVQTTNLALFANHYPVFSVAGGNTYINMQQTPAGGGLIYAIAIDTAFNVELTATYFV